MATCYTGTNLPELQEENCNGDYTSTACIVNPNPLTYLELPANSLMPQILTNIILAFQRKDEQIAELQAQIEALTP